MKFITDDFNVGLKTACPARWNSESEPKSVLQFSPKAHRPIVSIVNFDDKSVTSIISRKYKSFLFIYTLTIFHCINTKHSDLFPRRF